MNPPVILLPSPHIVGEVQANSLYLASSVGWGGGVVVGEEGWSQHGLVHVGISNIFLDEVILYWVPLGGA